MSRKVKWGVMGTAMICERDTIPGMLQADNCELTAIAGRSLEKAELFRQKYGFEKAYGSYDELLADSEVEAVYIALPNTLHHEWTIKACKAGKHVLCEKPLAPSEKEAKEMFEAARENGVFLMEAFAYLHSPYINEIRDLIRSGAIGDVEYMESTFLTSSYDNTNIRMRRETLGGSLYDLGVYCQSLILRMLDKEPSKVLVTSEFSADRIDTLTNGMSAYEDGTRVISTCGMLLTKEQDHWSADFTICGSKGMLKSGPEFCFNGKGELTYTIMPFGAAPETHTVQIPQNYRLEVEQLGRCITDGETPAVSEEFSLALSRIIDMMLKSMSY